MTGDPVGKPWLYSFGIAIACWLPPLPAMADMMVPSLPLLLGIDNPIGIITGLVLMAGAVVIESDALTGSFGFKPDESFRCALRANLFSAFIGIPTLIFMGPPRGRSLTPPLFLTWSEAENISWGVFIMIATLAFVAVLLFESNPRYFKGFRMGLVQFTAIFAASAVFFYITSSGLNRGLLYNTSHLARGGKLWVVPWFVLTLIPGYVFSVILEYPFIAKLCSARGLDCNEALGVTARVNLTSYLMVILPGMLIPILLIQR